MTNKDRYKYNRQINAGKLPWEVDDRDQSKLEHPVFMENKSKDEGSTDGARVQPLSQDFIPEPAYIEFLSMHHGIPEDFSLKQLPEFKLYWLETGEARKAWQSKFKNHVIYQWKRNKSEAGKRSKRSTAEQLTDTSWQEDNWSDQLGD